MIVGSASMHHHGHHGPPPRPSTSPVPNLFASSANRKTAAATASRVHASAAQQAASVRLRPLPPATQRAGWSGSGMGGFMIQGTTTGEEKERTAVDRREGAPSTAASSSSLSVAERPPAGGRSTPSTSEKNAEAERLKLRNRKLETDLKKAQDLAKRRAAEATAAQDSNADLKADLTSSRAALAEAQQALASEKVGRATDIASLERDRDVLKGELDKLRRESEDAVSQSRDLLAAQTQSTNQNHAAETAKLRAGADAATADATEQRRRADQLQRELDASKQDLAATRQQLEAERDARQASDAVNVARLAQLEREALEAREELASWKARIEQVDGFVLEICQPQFAVVKDDTMAPMDPDARNSEKEGFVLVPLHLLLQGYALLPGAKKQSIASRYEAGKK